MKRSSAQPPAVKAGVQLDAKSVACNNIIARLPRGTTEPAAIAEFLEGLAPDECRTILECHVKEPPEGLYNMLPPDATGDYLGERTCDGPLDGGRCVNVLSTPQESAGEWCNEEWTCWMCMHYENDKKCSKSSCPAIRGAGQCPKCRPRYFGHDV